MDEEEEEQEEEEDDRYLLMNILKTKKCAESIIQECIRLKRENPLKYGNMVDRLELKYKNANGLSCLTYGIKQVTDDLMICTVENDERLDDRLLFLTYLEITFDNIADLIQYNKISCTESYFKLEIVYLYCLRMETSAAEFVQEMDIRRLKSARDLLLGKLAIRMDEDENLQSGNGNDRDRDNDKFSVFSDAGAYSTKTRQKSVACEVTQKINFLESVFKSEGLRNKRLRRAARLDFDCCEAAMGFWNQVTCKVESMALVSYGQYNLSCSMLIHKICPHFFTLLKHKKEILDPFIDMYECVLSQRNDVQFGSPISIHIMLRFFTLTHLTIIASKLETYVTMEKEGDDKHPETRILDLLEQLERQAK